MHAPLFSSHKTFFCGYFKGIQSLRTIDAMQTDYNCALQRAAELCHVHIIEWLLSEKMQGQQDAPLRALFAACESRHLSAVQQLFRWLVQTGCDIGTVKDPRERGSMFHRDAETVLQKVYEGWSFHNFFLQHYNNLPIEECRVQAEACWKVSDCGT